MGGIGSGRGIRPTRGGRVKTDEVLALNIRDLQRLDLLDKRASILTWIENDQRIARIGIQRRDQALALSYTLTNAGREPEQVEQTVSLNTTHAKHGGPRQWMRCPFCASRVAILYQRHRRFRCRKCADLVYRSQSESPGFRALRRALKLHDRLGGDGELWGDFPSRPDGMREATYRARIAALERAEDEALSMIFSGLPNAVA